MDFQVNSTYSFKVYAANILTSDFSNVVVEGIMSFNVANKFKDVRAVHAQVYPQLPPGSPDQPTKYQYLQIRYPNNSTDIIGIPWIQQDTIELIEQVTLRYDISNAKSTDITRINQVLVANGFNSFTSTIL